MNLFLDFRTKPQDIPTNFELVGNKMTHSIEGMTFDDIELLIRKLTRQSVGTVRVVLLFDHVQQTDIDDVITRFHQGVYNYVISTAENTVLYSVYDDPFYTPSDDDIEELGAFTIIPCDGAGAYEYYLHAWGGMYNENLLETRYGIKGSDFWFNTAAERDAFEAKLLGYASECGEVLRTASEEGRMVRYKPVMTYTLTTPDGITADITYEARYGYALRDLIFLHMDGNNGCDCNKSLIMTCHGADVPFYDCGGEIKVSNCIVELVR